MELFPTLHLEVLPHLAHLPASTLHFDPLISEPDSSQTPRATLGRTDRPQDYVVVSDVRRRYVAEAGVAWRVSLLTCSALSTLSSGRQSAFVKSEDSAIRALIQEKLLVVVSVCLPANVRVYLPDMLHAATGQSSLSADVPGSRSPDQEAGWSNIGCITKFPIT